MVIQLDFLDKDNQSMFDCVMPYIAIQHYKYNENTDGNDINGRTKKPHYFMNITNHF